MKIILAPDSFKDSLTAPQACLAMEKGIRRILPEAEIVHIPMADGGEGTVQAMVAATEGTLEYTQVHGPLGEIRQAEFGILGNTAEKIAVIEMAASSGLPLVPDEKRNPLNTTTFGLGQLIKVALKKDCQKFLIGIGGSATNDCGTGMAQALGVKFFDEDDNKITDFMTGGLLGKVARIDTSAMAKGLKQAEFLVVCDVDNPLLGTRGATYVYGLQKGATPEMLQKLETYMTSYAKILQKSTGKKVADQPCAGAAGGLGAALMALLAAELKPGIQIVLEHAKFAQKIADADLIITGEGKIDGSTVYGKTISGIAAQAQKANIPVIAIAGTIGPDAEKILDHGVAAITSICKSPMTVKQAIENADPLLADATEQAMRLIKLNLTE